MTIKDLINCCLIVFLVASLLLCCIFLKPSEGEIIRHGINTYDEWISPDGVHYWVNTTNYAISPRYDRNGNLVID